MSLLGPADPLPARPSRVLVAGPPGSGKTTLAAAIGRTLGLPHTEIDGLYWGPGWTRRPEFEAEVAAVTRSDRWVTEYQYDVVRPVLLARSDLVVALQLPVVVAMTRLTRRTVRRSRRQTPLWNDNVEAPLRTLFADPDHILRWGWRNRRTTATRVEHVRRERPDLPVVVLRRPAEVRSWLAGPVASV